MLEQGTICVDECSAPRSHLNCALIDDIVATDSSNDHVAGGGHCLAARCVGMGEFHPFRVMLELEMSGDRPARFAQPKFFVRMSSGASRT